MAEKVMSAKRKTVEGDISFDVEDLVVGGEGMKGFYDNILPKTANKLLSKLGSKIEPVDVVKGAPSQMPFESSSFLDWMQQNHPGTSRSDAARAWGMGIDNNLFVKEFYEATKADQHLGFKITPEMIDMVKTQGLPQFAAGGEVSTTDFIRKREKGSPPEGETSNDEYIQQMLTGDINRSARNFSPEVLSMMRKERIDPGSLKHIPLPKGSPHTATAGLPGLRTYVDPDLTGTETAGYVFSATPPTDTSMFVRKDVPLDTVAHEAEHLLARRQLGRPYEVNAVFDQLIGEKEGNSDRRYEFVKNASRVYPYLQDKYGLQSAYFDPRMIIHQGPLAPNLLYEQLASLAAIENTQGVDLTKDPELRKTLFKDKDVRETYSALTGLRQTRLDSKDIRPYTRIPEKGASITDRIKSLMGFAQGGEVRTADFIKKVLK